MSVRTQVGQARDFGGGQEFGRRASAQPEDDLARMGREVERLASIVVAQAHQLDANSQMIAECQKAIVRLSRQIADTGTRPAPSAPMTARPVPPRIEEAPRPSTTRREAPPIIRRDAPAARPVDLGAAFRKLAARAGLAKPEELLEQIEGCAAQHSLPSDSRTAALAKATFSLLSDTLTGDAAATLEPFVVELLGTSASLIEPQSGDTFDPTLHHDYSTEVIGSRGRIRRVVFPGLKDGATVVIRARVLT